MAWGGGGGGGARGGGGVFRFFFQHKNIHLIYLLINEFFGGKIKGI